MRNFDKSFERSDRTFKIMFRCLASFIGLVFVGIIGFWIFVGYLGYSVATSDPNDLAKGVGSTIGQLKKGFDQGYNDGK